MKASSVFYSNQKTNFKACWTILGSPEDATSPAACGPLILAVIWPKLELLSVATGVARFTRLSRLKASPRTWKVVSANYVGNSTIHLWTGNQENPAMVFRFVPFPVVAIPERKISCVACRPFRGRSTTRFWSTTVPTPVLCVSTIVASASTSTCSLTDPTFKATSIVGFLSTCRTVPD